MHGKILYDGFLKWVMAIVVASSDLSDDAFLAAFTACELPGEKFRHGDHLRLAWLHSRSVPLDLAIERTCDGIRRYAIHNGKPQAYHATITIAWVRLVATHTEPTFADFISQNEAALTIERLHQYWSAELLDSAEARAGWVEPDRASLPEARLQTAC